MKQLIDRNPVTGKLDVYLDNGDGEVGFYTEQDCEPVMELARDLADLPAGKDLRHVAEVPLVFVDQAIREGWYHDAAAWKRFLNDPQYRAFRVHGGQV